MNSLFFACCDCKIYINAGNRWAYWELEDAGVVCRAKRVDVDAVLSAEKYWNPSMNEDTRWLYEEIFPPLREFLHDHEGHRIVFGEEEEFAPIERDNYFDWMPIGYLSKPTPSIESMSLGESLKAYWSSHGIQINAGISEDELNSFEAKHDLVLPEDLRDYFLTVDGMAPGDVDDGMIRFWMLDEVIALPQGGA